MSPQVLKFNAQDKPEFFKELRKRVNTYFKENNISRYGNFGMKVKTAFMLCLYFVPFILMLTGVVSSIWGIMLIWAIMGLGMSGIGLSVMHDAIHGTYSKNQKVNKVVGYVIHFIGGYHLNWKMQHNVLHHTFTNVDGFDDDLETGIMRFSPKQKLKKGHRFQAFYAWFFYGLLTLNWAVAKDFKQLVRYNKRDLLKGQGWTFKAALTEATIHKIWYFALMIALPIVVVAVPWWITVLGFVLMHFVCGVVLSFIFQLAHVIEETQFYAPAKDSTLENNWAVHQMRTTANFSNKSKWFTWLIGGLNFQVEHHLFPNICHIHYPKISKIVRETAEEFGLPYNQHKTFFGALRSHLVLLNNLGTGKYDRMMATA